MTFLAGPLASAGVSFLGSKLFGGDDKNVDMSSVNAPTQNFKPVNFNGGGLSSSFDNGSISIGANSARQGLVNNLAGQFKNQASEISALRPSVAPGFSDLRASRLQEIENARTNAIGNLRENMARRRVLGSSFGQDALARAELEAGQAKSKIQAETFLQELEATNNLINQEFEARRGQFQTGLDELNLEASLASKLASSATDQLGANARIESQLNMKGAELDAKAQEGKGKFFGQLVQPVAKEVGSQVSKFFAAA